MFVTLWAVVFSALAWTWSVGISNAVAHNLTQLLVPRDVPRHRPAGADDGAAARPVRGGRAAGAAPSRPGGGRRHDADVVTPTSATRTWCSSGSAAISWASGLHRGWLRTGGLAGAWTAIAGGAASTVALIALGWPVTAVGFGDRPLSNLQPTAAMVTLGVAQLGVLGLLSRRRLDWLGVLASNRRCAFNALVLVVR